MNVSEENVLCNICGSDDFVLKFIGKDRQYKLPGEFRVVECRTCGLLYINPRPIVKSLAQYYPQIYWGASVSHRPLTRIAKLDAMLDAMLVNAISYHMTVPEVEGGTLLDIGCGEGSYLASMKRAGWDVYGVEPSAVACELARRKWGLEVFNGTIDEASFPDDKFDGITMHHVLEHTDNPSEVLVEIHRILKPDGVLAISVPDAKSLESKIFGSAWIHWDLPRHLYHFSRATITAMLEKTGFSVTKIKHDSHPGGVLSSLLYVFEDAKLNPKIGLLLARPLSFLLAPALGALSASGSMAIYAAKRERRKRL